jgi:hypothetical protein
MTFNPADYRDVDEFRTNFIDTNDIKRKSPCFTIIKYIGVKKLTKKGQNHYDTCQLCQEFASNAPKVFTALLERSFEADLITPDDDERLVEILASYK